MTLSWSREAGAPALPAAGAVAAGTLAGVSFPVAPSGPMSLALTGLAAVALVLGMRGDRRLRAIGGLTLLLVGGFHGTRTRYLDPARRDADRALRLGEETSVEVVGRIVSPWTSTGSRHRTRLQPELSRAGGKDAGFERPIFLIVAGTADPASVADVGDRVRVEAPVRLPARSSLRSPFALPLEPSISMKTAGQIARLGGPAGPLAPVLLLHRWMKGRLAANLGHGERPALALFLAIFMGETADLPGSTVSAFRDGGVAHVLAISGAQVALVAFLVGTLLRVAPLSTAQRDAVVLLFVLLFAVFAGAQPPVLRAALMIGLYLLARLLGRPTSPTQVLGFAALVLLLLAPEDLFDVGFLLTFAAVSGLSAFGPAFAAGLSSFVPSGAVRQALGATLAAELAVFPVQAFVFNVVPLVALVSNVVAVPLSGLFLTFGLALLPLLLIGPTVAPVAFVPLGLVHDALLWFLAALDRLHAVRVVPTPPFALVALLALAIAAAGPRGRLRPWAFGLAGLLILGILLAPARRALDQESLLLALDVGQGDSWALVTRSGRILVDGGGTPDAAYEFGRARLLPRLCDQGLVSFDAVVLTHPHPDHTRGLVAVFGLLPVGRFIVPAGAPRNVFLDEVLEAAARGGVEVRRCRAGERLEEAAIALDVLHPGRETYPRSRENNGSLVLRTRLEGRRLLLTGDIEALAERDLLARGGRLAADVLKVPHHGSRTSTTPELLSAVAPRLALIGVGRRNHYGHPNADVLARLSRAHVRVLRTDRDGEFALRFAHGRIWPIFSEGAEGLR